MKNFNKIITAATALGVLIFSGLSAPPIQVSAAPQYAAALTFRSIGEQDGWVKESDEFSQKGGYKNALSNFLLVGDDDQDRQICTILSFDTSLIPDNGVVSSAVLELRRAGTLGSDPAVSLGILSVAVKSAPFGGDPGLQVVDFQARANAQKAGVYKRVSGTNRFTSPLKTSRLYLVSTTGVTQLRVCFTGGDNDNQSMDAYRFYSGDEDGLDRQPSLTVQYFIPEKDPAVWYPAVNTSWQIQLAGILDTGVDVQVYDVDLFDTPRAKIDQLHADGRKVICYFSAGSWEDWRPDAGDFPDSVIGKSLDGWPGENWLDIRKIKILGPIMSARLDLAVQKTCDGVDPDNVDGFRNGSGFKLNFQNQFAYNLWLAEQAHARKLSIGLKNDLSQIKALVPYFDWSLNEQCFEYLECGKLLPFVQSGKPVFGIEYQGAPSSFCPQANLMDFNVLKKRLNLKAWRIPCR